MPYRSYRRRYTPRRRYYGRRRTYRRRRYTPRSSPERKYYQAVLSTFSSVGNTWTELDLLGGITQGLDAYAQRIGRSINVIGVQIKGVLWGGATGVSGVDDPYDNIRYVVTRQSQTKTGGPLTPFASSSVAISSPLSRSVNPQLEHIYRDKFIGFTNHSWSAGSANPAHRVINDYIRFKRPLKVNFTGTSGNYNQTQIYLHMISDSPIVPNPGFVNGWFKVIYTDA